MKQSKFSSTQKLYLFLALGTFFFMITAQVFWSAIHGDGAVYAWITRAVTEDGIFTERLPHLTPTHIFAEHPYLFFYYSALFTKILGFSDFALKIPNFVIAALSIFSVYKISRKRHHQSEASHRMGLIAGYALILNAAYILQVSQPSLDPLAQLLSLFSVVLLIFYRRPFFSGLVLGLAFFTKGLELLPNLAALSLLTCYLERKNFSQVLKNLSLQYLGVLLPILAWLGFDSIFWNGQWLITYWARQFTGRFFKKENMQTVFDFGILLTFVQIYFVEIIILIVGLIHVKKIVRKDDPFFLYFLCYIFFNLLAFLIIKKDSSQHLTGILLVGSIFIGEYLWAAWAGWKRPYFIIFSILGFLLTFGYWSYFILGSHQNTDIWTSIKNESKLASTKANAYPIVVKDAAESYGLFHTAQWYFYPHKVYNQSEANVLLVDQVVYLLDDRIDGKLRRSDVVYKPEVF